MCPEPGPEWKQIMKIAGIPLSAPVWCGFSVVLVLCPRTLDIFRGSGHSWLPVRRHGTDCRDQWTESGTPEPAWTDLYIRVYIRPSDLYRIINCSFQNVTILRNQFPKSFPYQISKKWIKLLTGRMNGAAENDWNDMLCVIRCPNNLPKFTDHYTSHEVTWLSVPGPASCDVTRIEIWSRAKIERGRSTGPPRLSPARVEHWKFHEPTLCPEARGCDIN